MRRIPVTLAAIILIASLATDAASQCSISHTAVSGAYELCAGDGSEWQWGGPGGFTSADPCVTVSMPGTYTLRTLDSASGVWSDPCSFTFTETPAGPACPIAGPDSVCANSTVTWCGPSGNYLYNWMGPDGPFSTSACVELSAPGDYTLDYYDPSTGNGDICTRTLFASDCSTPPPPPPAKEPPGCPLTSREWSRTCGEHGMLVDPAAFAQVAARVDARSAVWTFADASDGLCHLLRRREHLNDRERALRQYAALLANVSAGELGVTASDGRKLGLDPSMSLAALRGMGADETVASWIARTEATLLAQAGRPARSRDSRDECRMITLTARSIMRSAPGCGTSLSAMLDDEDELDASSISASSGFSPGAGTLSTPSGADPLTGPRRLRWTLERAGDVQLDVVDVTGRRVRHLADGRFAAGTHDLAWDGRDDGGRMLRAGAYFVVGRVGGERTTARLFLLH